MLFLNTLGYAVDFPFTSTKYHYSISLPSGWVQIPDAVVTQQKNRLPPQAQNLIYDAVFQRGNSGTWFSSPYVIVQVIQSGRQPTEAEFQKFVNVLSGGKLLTKLDGVISSIKDADDRAKVKSMAQSLSTATIQVDVARRKYQFVVNETNQHGTTKTFIYGYFMPDGNLIQLNAYTNANSITHDLGDFLSISNSLSHIDSQNVE